MLSCGLLRGRNSTLQQSDCVERKMRLCAVLLKDQYCHHACIEIVRYPTVVSTGLLLQAWWTTSCHDGLLVYVVCLITCPFSEHTNSANFVKIAQGIRPFGPLLLRAKFHRNRCNDNGIGPQNWNFTEIWHGVRSLPPRQISPPSVQRLGHRTPKTEIFNEIWSKGGI